MSADSYPTLICRACAVRNGGRPIGPIVPWQAGTCGWCNAATTVTTPAVFGNPASPRNAAAPLELDNA